MPTFLIFRFFSKGNYNNEGDQRKQELLQSCKILGIKNVTTLDNKYVIVL